MALYYDLANTFKSRLFIKQFLCTGHWGLHHRVMLFRLQQAEPPGRFALTDSYALVPDLLIWDVCGKA